MNSNTRLSIANSITSIGDWLSYFSIITLSYSITNNVGIAALSVPLRSCAGLISAILTPIIMNRFPVKSLLVNLQFLGGTLSIIMALLALNPTLLNLKLIFLGVLFGTILKGIFDVARETYSKITLTSAFQLSAQAEILQGIYGAQVIGPLLAFFALSFVPAYSLLLVDGISFLLCAKMLMPLSQITTKPFPKIERIWSILKSDLNLRKLFAIRGFLFWIPTSIFNTIMFAIVTKHLKQEAYAAALIYTVIGLGSVISASLLKKKYKTTKHKKNNDNFIAVVALATQGVFRFGVLKCSTMIELIGLMTGSGICNGANAVATQSMRRSFCSDLDFPTVVAAEGLISKLVDTTIGALTVAYLMRTNNQYLQIGEFALFCGMLLALTQAYAFKHSE